MRFAFGDLTKFVGKYELKELERWLKANTKSMHSFKLSDSTHTDMALQRHFSFWPQLRIHTNNQPSSSNRPTTPRTPRTPPSNSSRPTTPRFNASSDTGMKRPVTPKRPGNVATMSTSQNSRTGIEGQIVDRDGCLVQLAWLERHSTAKYFKDALTYDPSINLI